MSFLPQNCAVKMAPARANPEKNHVEEKEDLIAEPDGRNFDGSELADHHGVDHVHEGAYQVLEHDGYGDREQALVEIPVVKKFGS